MTEFTEDKNCFVCGPDNPSGLKLQFRHRPDQTESDVTFPAFLQGWQNVAHGGAISMVLDEVMVQAAMAKGIQCVTAELTVAFKKPVATLQPYVAVGRVLESRGRITHCEGELKDATGQVFATSKAKVFRVGKD